MEFAAAISNHFPAAVFVVGQTWKMKDQFGNEWLFGPSFSTDGPTPLYWLQRGKVSRPGTLTDLIRCTG
jgi:hypothetical protein